VSLTAVSPFFWPPGDGDEPEGRPLGSIGHDGVLHFVARGDGAVVARDPAGMSPDQYVNLSVGQFARSLRLFDEQWRRRSGLSESEAKTQAKDLLRELAGVDPTAFAHGTSWWSTVMEQLIAGLI
jgi:hypothetical protein